MSHIYLHGGGDSPDARELTFGRLVEALEARPGRLALIVASPEEDEAAETDRYYRLLFIDLGLPATRLTTLFVTPERPPRPADLESAGTTAVFVCGGLTPFYHAALTADTAWVDYLRRAGLIYFGSSAGAAVAARRAVLGGWLSPAGRGRRSPARQILFRGAAEGLERLTVRPGLGLVPFSVDVHAGQSGTLTRLIHAVRAGLTPEGWAVDEDTMLVVGSGGMELHGLGHAYRVRRAADGALTTVYTARTAADEDDGA